MALFPILFILVFTTAIKHFCHSTAHSKAFRGTAWSFYRSGRGRKCKWCLADRVQQAKSHRVWQEVRHTHAWGAGCGACRQRTANNCSKKAGNPPELNQDPGEKHCNTRDTFSVAAFASQVGKITEAGQ